MRYQFPVTDFAELGLPHLSAAESKFARVLARPRFIAIACIVALTALGWAALGLMAADATSFSWQALCRPGVHAGPDGLAIAAPMWAAMVLAMMLPTAGPMILTYSEIADTAAAKGETVVSPGVLASGYLAVWLGFAMVGAVLQVLLAGQSVFEAGSAGPWFAGTMLVGAGLYQFSALKQACLTKCQRPFPFFFANWTTERFGVLRLGLRQGLSCLGCCWAMMLLMLTAGTMNLIWMAALGVVMAIEKMTSTPRFSQAVGAALIAFGAGTIGASLL
jgi:predicted metal-binding membrane protein